MLKLKSAYDNPPSRWVGATPAGSDVYFLAGVYFPDDDEDTGTDGYLVFHWCTPNSRWHCQGIGDHTLIAADPLTLTPSLLWPCCGKHGYIRAGVWQDV